MNARRPHFIKGFNPNISFDKLKIPSKFVKHLEGKTSGTVYLVGPSGNTWHADLAQETDGLFILNGWTAFVRDHFLENGDSLVFRYDDNLHFTLQIFDQSCCEKETAFSAECHQDLSIFDQHFGKKRDREYASWLSSTVDFVPKKPRSQPHEADNLHESVNEQCEAADFLNNVDFSSSGLETPITSAMPISEVSPNDDEIERLSASEADKIARSFTSSFPHFTQNVPYQFAMAYLPDRKVKIMLHNSKGESWTINSIPTTRVQTSHTFCGGWVAFVRSNNINVGDICIFELVGNCEMRVNILRVRQEPLDYDHGDVNGPVNGASKRISGRLTKTVKRKSFTTQSPALLEGQKVAFSIEKVKHGIAAKGSVDCHSRTTNKKSVMKNFNISGSYTLKIPVQFSMEHLPNCKTAITLRNLEGECWTVRT
ncbi:hypothetical protein M8C21_020400 [Ambrosia artemisiifolia]|uniref:TF-B3 domain-containing protein n=1 Tax=Ambrosia artemisiifolia TaxID=4212 RepID=A0AAD5D320_AMBAR|nr:hypothetical protein M8C21_020400 [Ambrosia artemisiifolia]